MIPGDGSFIPYEPKAGEPTSKTNGRIFVLKFSSSSQRHLFWLQSKPQSSTGNPSWLSPRDRKIGEIVNILLQGEEVDVNAELATVRNNNQDNDDDEPMEDIEGHGDRNESGPGGAGGAGPGATGGDIREEGESAREGGADGARAAADAAVRNLLASLQGGTMSQPQSKAYPALNDLLPPSETVPMVQALDDERINNLLTHLPPAIIVLAQAGGADVTGEPSPDAVEAAKSAMTIGEKKALVARVLRSPQFSQSLASLTVAIREGGLPMISEALGVKVVNGGYMRRGGMPLGGSEAVEAFVEGVKKTVQE